MSPDRTPDIRDCGADVAAYALGALEPAEADAFRRHLESCAVCRDELAAFDQVVEMLPMSAPQHRAPKALRRRVLRAIDDEPMVQLAGERRRQTRRWRPSLTMPRPAMAFSAIVLVAAVALGVTQLGGSGAARTQVIRAQVIGTPGSAEVKLTSGRAELIVHHFSPPPAGQIYEVWLGRPNRPPAPTSALFSVTASGEGDVDVPGNLRGVNRVMVTPEPAGGTRVPTHPAVILAKLA